MTLLSESVDGTHQTQQGKKHKIRGCIISLIIFLIVVIYIVYEYYTSKIEYCTLVNC